MSLPENYTQVRYIESSGTQYIDTGFKPNNNTRVVMDVQMITLAQPNFFFGVRTSSNTVNYSVLITGSNFRSDYGESKVSSSEASATDRVTIDKNQNVCTVNSATITNTSSTFQSAYNLYLFASNDGGTAAYFGYARLYGCQIYDNGTLIRDFVPCKNASGAVGLYDTVNSVFYPDNAGGTFTAGAEVVPDYKIVDANALDYALTATADSIKAKTGDSAPIAWDNEKGFSDAVATIASVKVAHGTYTDTNTISIAKNLNEYPITVSGIGFKPKRVIFYLAYPNNSGSAQNTLWHIEGGERTHALVGGSAGTSAASITNATAYITMTMDADGFTISSTSTTYKQWTKMPYNYTAIG